ncbi:MAG: hypothetical protein ACI9SY_000750 [Candidatus Paceibacteria bacterium]|jgi:hypothetical protein
MRFSILTILFFALALPETTTAQGIFDGVCSGIDCSACDIAVIANTFISWLIGAVMVLFAVLMVIAGFGLVTSGGNPDALNTAKSKFTNAIIGLIIVLSAWLIVDTLMKALVGESGQVSGNLAWSEIQCMTQVEATTVPGEVTITAAELSETGDFPELDAVNGPGSFTAYTFNPIEGCRTRISQSFGGVPACEVALQSFRTTSPQSYVTYSCDGGPTNEDIPSWSRERECGLPVSPAGQVCYPSGACFNTVTLAQAQAAAPGQYNYPMAGPSQFIDFDNPGDGVTVNTRISDNYTLADFNRSGRCGRGGRFMYMDPRSIAGLERIVDALGTRPGINSGYRSPGCNSSIPRAATRSRHMLGTGFDIDPPGGRSQRCDVVRACRAAGASFIMTYGTDSSHVHCDWGGSGEILNSPCP